MIRTKYVLLPMLIKKVFNSEVDADMTVDFTRKCLLFIVQTIFAIKRK